MTFKPISDFLFAWQDLMGAALGPFIAIILSAMAFWLKGSLKERSDYKEALRQIENALTKSINESLIARENLKIFSNRVKELADKAKNDTNPKAFFLEVINYPPIPPVYRDQEITKLRVKNYYLHNKLQFVDSGIVGFNSILAQLKPDFDDLIKQNQALVGLMTLGAIANNPPSPPSQKNMYSESLLSFSDALNQYTAKHFQKLIRVLVETKVFNLHLMEHSRFWIWWNYEPAKLKFFWTKKAQRKYSMRIETIDPMNELLKSEVDDELEKIEARLQEILDAA